MSRIGVLLFLQCLTLLRATPARTVGLCVLDDKKAPVSRATITTLIDRLSTDYAAQVGIAFRIAELHDYHFVSSENEGRTWKSCAKSDAIVVFTNSDRHELRKSGERELLGREYSGAVWIYRTEHRAPDESSAFTTLEHEIAHLFGVRDDRDPNSKSFMNFHGRGTSWTEKIRNIIRNHIAWAWGGVDDIT